MRGCIKDTAHACGISTWSSHIALIEIVGQLWSFIFLIHDEERKLSLKQWRSSKIVPFSKENSPEVWRICVWQLRWANYTGHTWQHQEKHLLSHAQLQGMEIGQGEGILKKFVDKISILLPGMFTNLTIGLHDQHPLCRHWPGYYFESPGALWL